MKHTYKKGDKVIVTATPRAEYPYFAVGDVVTLTRQDSDGDWWGDFAANEDCWDDGQWCLEGGAGVEFQIACSLSEEQIDREASEQFDFQRAFRAARALIDATQEVEERRAEYEAAIAGM